MEKSAKIKKILFILLTVIVFSFYIVFEIRDIFRLNYEVIFFKYSCIVLFFLFSFIEFKNWDKKHIFFRIAYLGTLISDFFLYYLDSYYEIGVMFFIFTQIFYFLYITDKSKGSLLSFFITVGTILIGTNILVFGILKMKPELLNFLVIVYFSLICGNAAQALCLHKKKGILLFIGFILFILCDINVGLNNSGIRFDNAYMSRIVFVLMWTFYLPSQYLIVISLDKPYLNEL